MASSFLTQNHFFGKRNDSKFHLLILTHTDICIFISWQSFFSLSFDLAFFCLGYYELQLARKPSAGDSVPAGAYNHRPEPAESHSDPARPDRGAGQTSGRAPRWEQAPAGRQGTTTAPIPSPTPSPSSPGPHLPPPSPPSARSPTKGQWRVSTRPCPRTSTGRGASGNPAPAC